MMGSSRISGMLRSCALALGLAFASFGVSVAHAIDRVVAVARHVGDYSARAEKFKAELSFNADTKAVASASVNADLVRDGHGFRQASASPVLWSQQPAWA